MDMIRSLSQQFELILWSSSSNDFSELIFKFLEFEEQKDIKYFLDISHC